jgi:hypothetical protein
VPIESRDSEISCERGYYPLARLCHVTKFDFQRQSTTKLNYKPRTAAEEHTIEINRIGSAIEAEQRDDSSVVAIESCDLGISCERGYYPLARLCHVTRSQANPLFDYYYNKSQHIARWLTTLKRPIDMSQQEYQTFKNKATRYSV